MVLDEDIFKVALEDVDKHTIFTSYSNVSVITWRSLYCELIKIIFLFFFFRIRSLFLSMTQHMEMIPIPHQIQPNRQIHHRCTALDTLD